MLCLMCLWWRFPPTLWVFSSFPWLFLLLYKSFWVRWGPTCQLLSLFPVQLLFDLESLFLHICLVGCCQLYLLAPSGFQVLGWDLWSTWSLFLYRVRGRGLILFFYKWWSSFANTICWRCYLSSIELFWPLCQIWGGWSYMSSSLDLQFCSIGQWFCFFASTRLSLWL